VGTWTERLLPEFTINESTPITISLGYKAANTTSDKHPFLFFEYEMIGYKESDLVKVDILVSGNPVDAFSFIAHKDNAYYRGRSIVEKLKEVIPRQQFEIPLQAALGTKIIARETIKALRASTAVLITDQIKAPTSLAVMIWCSETGKVKVR